MHCTTRDLHEAQETHPRTWRFNFAISGSSHSNFGTLPMMYLPLQEPFFDELLRNLDSRSYNQITSAYASDGSLSHVYKSSFENFPYDASPASQEEKPTIMPSLGYHAMPIDIPSTALVDPSLTPPTTALIQNLPGYSSSSSSSSSSHSHSSSSSSPASGRGDSTPWTLCQWSKVHSGVPDAMGHESYYPNVRDPEFSNNHSFGYLSDGLNTFSGGLATSPGVDAKASTTEAMDVRQGQYNAIHSGNLVHRPVLRRHRYEQTGDQIGEPRIYDRRFTCTINKCGKSFSGEWEKARHIKSIHGPPTIGCRVCNYKQSRKDLFSEHCRKRHPGESIEELMVQLVHNNGVSP